ncbi:hypothetical protein J0B03_03535 [Alkalibacter rhizosphaerae]|uniref:RNA polymerase sigma factor SigI n=1 Tax=Alkalibacter rhizosphaerae TaxID=2815577 RepID=A0A975AI03_9FIRM|nr:sigma factor [Alkalibacter rhizosphaerae]QSX09154.1 hypothetical protein J0B03_03535 [Alkalibacter rhizosphaerae]
MRELDQRIKSIAEEKNKEKLEQLIREWEFFILKSAVRVSKKYVSKQDEEWSVALEAFMEAVQRYDMDKGAFLPFARRMIHHRLVDHFRKQGRSGSELPLESLDRLRVYKPDPTSRDLRDEIDALTQVLQLYGLDFADLAKASPKSDKTVKACKKILFFLTSHPELTELIKDSKLLPLKEIEKNTGVPRKTIERHRKYLIAAMEILTGDYPYLAAYIPRDGGEGQ